MERSKNPRSYWASVLALTGHLIGTAVIFAALFTIGWIIALTLHALHEIHPFPADIFGFITRMEVYILYADAVLSGIVLLTGMWRFCSDVISVRP